VTDYPITLLWHYLQASSPGFVVIARQWWRRPNGQIQAWYNDQEELRWCVLLMEALTERKGDDE